MEILEKRKNVIVGEKRYSSIVGNCVREGQKAVFKLECVEGVWYKIVTVYWCNMEPTAIQTSEGMETETIPASEREEKDKTFPMVCKAKNRSINRKWTSKMSGSRKEDKILNGNPEMFGKEVETDWKWIEKHS